MADLVISAASVKAGTTATINRGTAGAQITQGEPIYEATDGKIYPASANVQEINAQAKGVAVNSAEAAQPVAWVSAGLLEIGAVATIGQVYVVSLNTGKIAPYADLLSTHWVTILGVATTTSILKLAINVSGVQKP